MKIQCDSVGTGILVVSILKEQDALDVVFLVWAAVCFCSIPCVCAGRASQVHRRARVSLLGNYWFLKACWNVNRDFDKLDLANVICTGVQAELDAC